MPPRNAISTLAIALLIPAIAATATQAQQLPGGGQATPASAVTVPPGFEVQLLRSAQSGEGSWVSMSFDDRGRLIVGRDKRGVARLTLSEQHDSVIQYEVLEDTLKHCRGVLYAHNSIYICATDSKGIYRLQDLDGDDKPEDLRLLRSLDYQSRYGHGTNQIVLGPDDMLYIVNGNEVAFPDDTDPNSPYRAPADDQLLPDPRDAVENVRVGHIVKTDPDGKQWQIIAGGFRNQFDMAFNAEGEMFTYDADMEWDIGQPWYRPTRLNHIVSGGEYGWRAGSGKWPAYYPDSLPTTVDMGLGSPTGMQFATESNFPERYRNALFMGDWQNGRILYVRVRPQGASYGSEYDGFLEGGALNVCDLAFGPDGALYFITGGRGSQSGLYRVTYKGPADDEAAPAANAIPPAVAAQNSSLRQLRRKLEQFHIARDDAAVETIWPHLASEDQWVRYAARVALENQDSKHWRQRALQESSAATALPALMALARQGRPEDQPDLLAAINRLKLGSLNRDLQLTAARVWQLSLIRQGDATPAERDSILQQISPLFPTRSIHLNRELARLLVFLKAPNSVPRLLAMIANATEQEEAIYYAKLLSQVTSGWTAAHSDTFVNWISESRTYIGGRLLKESLQHIYDDFLAQLSSDDQARLKPQIAKITAQDSTVPSAKHLEIVRKWTWDDLQPVLQESRQKPSWEKGRSAIAKAACLKCHRLGEQGAFVGPDLTAVGRRFSEQMLLESILQPSKVIDEKYRNSTYVLADGKVHSGHPTAVSATTITLSINLLSPETVAIPRDQIEEIFPSELSPMPAGLIDVLTKDEIMELIAYVRAGGDSNSDLYQRATEAGPEN